MRVRGLTGLIMLVVMGGSEVVLAQSSFAPAVEPEQWQDLSPDTRNEMRRQYIKTLPPTTREKLRSQVERFQSMSPDKKQELCRRFQKDRGYRPPLCQKPF